MPPHPQSLAATNRAAFDLAGHLRGILSWFDALRAADRDVPPHPQPAWWDGYVKSDQWRIWTRDQQRPSNRQDRTDYASRQTQQAIKEVLAKWEQLTAPVPLSETSRWTFAACKESLRNLGGILAPQQEQARLRHGVIPTEWHLARPLPKTWAGPRSPGKEEVSARDRIDRAAYAIATASSDSEREAAKARREPLIAAHARLRAAREVRNAKAEKWAKQEGRVTVEQLEQIKQVRADWEEQAKRWKLGEADVRSLLVLLEEPFGSAVPSIARSQASESASSAPAPGGGDSRARDRRTQRAKWLAQAMLLVRDHPEWTDAQIARSVGKSPGTLSRSKEYQAAASMARRPSAPEGFVEQDAANDRRVVATDDSSNPLRRRSRMSQEDEELDDRIDREINERNSKRNAR